MYFDICALNTSIMPYYQGQAFFDIYHQSTPFKKEITLDEYFEDGRTFGKRRIVLDWEVDEIRASGNQLFIKLVYSAW